MMTDTKIRILGYIKTNGQARVRDLVEHLGIGKVALHRQLKSLVESGKLAKSDLPPKCFILKHPVQLGKPKKQMFYWINILRTLIPLVGLSPEFPDLELGSLMLVNRIRKTVAYPGKLESPKNFRKIGRKSQNAKETIFVDKINSRFNNLLLIDDAVGSAAI